MGVQGKRGQKKEVKKYTEKDIQDILTYRFMSGVNGARYHMENLYVYRWESDFLYVTKAGYVYEIEIKVSHSDFVNDMKKVEKHQILEGKYVFKKWDKEYPQRPNYFYYAVPEGLVTIEEVPEYAGLIYINEDFPYVHVIKNAPSIQPEKIDEEKLKLKEKFYYNYLTWKNKAEKKYAVKLERMKMLVEESKVEGDKKFKYTLREAHEKIEELTEELERVKEAEKQWQKEYFLESDFMLELRKMYVDKGGSWQEIMDKRAEIRKRRLENA